MPPRPARRAPAATGERRGPWLVPCLMLKGGVIHVPGDSGPEPARTAAGGPYDLFEVLDALTPRYARLYVVDLDGIEENRPQLDYLQEIARDTDMWLEAGARTADDAIDALVAGATKVVLTSGALEGPDELEKAWKLSNDLAFSVDLRSGRVDSPFSVWREGTPETLAAQVRSAGPQEIILSPRDAALDWELVRRLSEGGPTWVGGVFEASDFSDLEQSGAAGGIFHLSGDLLTTTEGSSWSSFSLPDPGGRDDES
ncbi:MAG TPA: HisA/HisF-related TIM barrel protein [Thermoplasmata archaeon]|nr:HisA/HisF-related TIM barrel protein [Thermoplasmata archaeon]